MKKTILLIFVAICVVFSGCIVNDLPYPRIQANILSLEIKGQDGGTLLDSVNMTATVSFPEEVDISSVRVTGYTLTPGAHLVDSIFNRNIDLSSPYKVTLRYYQDYVWRIIGKQTIERYFEVEGQIGASVIDVPGRRVIVHVSDKQPLDKIKIVKAKLGPIGYTSVPSLDQGTTFDGRQPFEVEVISYGVAKEWSIYTEVVEVSLRTESVDAWSCVAWINGIGEAGKEFGAEYRLAGTEEWTKVSPNDITSDGGNFTAKVIHLSPNTAYQARVYSEGLYGDIVDFTTGDTPQMPNSDFEYWWLDKKVWCPWQENGDPYWGTGNTGAATLGQSNTTPTEDTPSGSGWAARLETRFVGIGSIGKLAAGNMFVGSYVRTVGTNGVLSFGRDFTEHPTKLRGYYKYNCVDITHVSNETSQMLGQPDTCAIWIALIDLPEPLEIRTAPSNRQLFDPDGDYVVAYGKLEMAQTVPNYVPFEIDIEYKSKSRKPKYILCVGSASKYGDYFTGGNGSVLYIDDFELLYDY